jgi:DUF917 family protein
VFQEKLVNAKEGLSGISRLQQYTQQPCTAIGIAEIGGHNALVPLLIAGETGHPVLDLDGFGRAFPELQMCIPYIYGARPVPCTIGETKGNQLLLTDVSPFRDPYKEVEGFMRVIVTQMGCSALIIFPPIATKDIIKYSSKNTLSQSWRLGRSVLLAQHLKEDPVASVIKLENGALLFQGKIVDVERITSKGFTRGVVTIQGLNDFDNQELAIDFQNEFLIVKRKNSSGDLKTLATVPDVISVMDTASGAPIFVEQLKYGLRVSVISLPAPPILNSERALSVVGPQMFNYKNDVYTPVGTQYVVPRSVIEEYNNQS